MKLWQKVFVVTLVFMLIGTQLTAYLIAYKNFRNGLESERDRLVSEHRLFVSEIETGLGAGLAESGRLVLDREYVESVLAKAAGDAGGKGCLAVIYREEENGRSLIVGNVSTAELERAVVDTGLPLEKERINGVTTDFGDETMTICCSLHHFGSCHYAIYTVYDVSESYDDFHYQVREIRKFSIIISLGTATILLILVVIMLRPIETIQKDIKQIARGNYGRRISIKGSPELMAIADSINDMAEAVEANVGDIQGIADSRKQFIDNLAHEMKTPLTSIMGFADILRIQRNIKEKQRVEYSGIILEEAKRLRSLSGKILQLATADKVQLDFTEADVEELMREVYTSVLPLIVDHGMKLEVTCVKDTRLTVDREMIKSLLYNLVDNAVKASGEGDEIRLDCSEVKGNIVISVADQGTGMSPEHVKKVTEPFYMVDKSRSRKAGGAGLGLALCVEIAKQHDAKLKIESELGKGTTVMVIFGDKK